MTQEVIDAIISGIGAEDTAIMQAVEIIENLKRAGFEIVKTASADTSGVSDMTKNSNTSGIREGK